MILVSYKNLCAKKKSTSTNYLGSCKFVACSCKLWSLNFWNWRLCPLISIVKVIMEIVRLANIVPGIFRKALQDVEIKGRATITCMASLFRPGPLLASCGESSLTPCCVCHLGRRLHGSSRMGYHGVSAGGALKPWHIRRSTGVQPMEVAGSSSSFPLLSNWWPFKSWCLVVQFVHVLLLKLQYLGSRRCHDLTCSTNSHIFSSPVSPLKRKSQETVL